jgi:hypothetical protein
MKTTLVLIIEHDGILHRRMLIKRETPSALTAGEVVEALKRLGYEGEVFEALKRLGYELESNPAPIFEPVDPAKLKQVGELAQIGKQEMAELRGGCTQ